MQHVAIRWTVGDVSEYGLQALGLSLRSAWGLFRDVATYTICYNGLTEVAVCRHLPKIPSEVTFVDSAQHVPGWLRDAVSTDFAEGVAWKLAPVRLYPDQHELCLDNDVILWSLPRSLAAWLKEDDSLLIEEDVWACVGQFSGLAGPAARNTGMRGLPPGFDLERHVQKLLREHPLQLKSELDEQGMQIAALRSSGAPAHLVTVDDVSICSPFVPHQANLGRCGGHFVGLNTKRTAWSKDGRPGHEYLKEHWRRHLPQLESLCEQVAELRAA